MINKIIIAITGFVSFFTLKFLSDRKTKQLGELEQENDNLNKVIEDAEKKSEINRKLNTDSDYANFVRNTFRRD